MWGGYVYVCGDCKLFCSHSPRQEEIFESPLQIISECCDFMAREKKKCRKSPSDYSHNYSRNYSHNAAHSTAVISRPKKKNTS